MIKPTSIETYRKIEAEGLLSKLRFAVYSAIYSSGASTSREIHSRFFPELTRDSISPRFVELERAGVIQSVGTKICEVSGHTAIAWQTNNNLPQKIERPISETQRLKNQLARYREALEFYADKSNWSESDNNYPYESYLEMRECGDKAREALRGDIAPEKGDEK